MSDEDITPKRGRGRPRKQEKTPAAEVTVASAHDDDLDEAVMQQQIKENLKSLLKLAAKQGISLEDLFDAPPKATTVVSEEPTANAEIDEELGIKPEPVAVSNNRPLPGTNFFDENGRATHWVPWTKADLAVSKKIKFTPRPIPTMVYPLQDEDGYYKIRLDVNGLVCFLTCGVENEVSEFFYNAYKNGEKAYIELEHFKNHGPDAAPWGAQGPDGRPAWRYTPQALSFGIDEDGNWLGARNNPFYQMQNEASSDE